MSSPRQRNEFLTNPSYASKRPGVHNALPTSAEKSCVNYITNMFTHATTPSLANCVIYCCAHVAVCARGRCSSSSSSYALRRLSFSRSMCDSSM